jgi:phosphoenolpyruvate---glycerone phosphotransferase subunit DhaK
MGRPKKIMNDPKNVVPELLEGLVEAYGGRIKKLDGVNALVKTHVPAGKVGLLIGGGSGHEPLFHGLIGDNFADGAACGNIFAAPSPDIVYEATRAIDQGKGVLYAYGNYAGDIFNFDMGAEMAAEGGIRVETVRIWDDISSSPLERIQERRGIAGDLLVIKIAGAVTAAGKDLDEAYRVTCRARDNTRSLSVALSAGSIPETGQPTFVLPEDEIEVGMGAHGEPGVHRDKLLPADTLVDMMMSRVLADLPFVRGDEVCVLINGLGATTMMELLIVNRRVQQVLRDQGIGVHDTIVGNFLTTQEMAGCSITLMRLDEELKGYYDVPANSFAFTKV